MNMPLVELEGTWEEIAAHGPELAGRRVRVTVLPEQKEPQPQLSSSGFRPSSGRPLLRHIGTWQGEDLQECLEAVIQSRLPAQFPFDPSEAD